MERKRCLVVGVVLALLLMSLSWTAAAAKTTVSVGRLPWGAVNTVVTQYMIKNKLFEKEAAKLGYDLEVDWRDYPSAIPQVEAMMGNRLDIGLWGNTPVIRNLSLGAPIHVIALGEGHLDFQVAVRPDSDIRTLEDLKGKKVGTLLGADPHFFFSMLLEAEFGEADPAKLGITMVNVPSYTQMATMPKGVDAVTLITPEFLKGREQGTVEGLVDNYGQTMEHYKGGAGKTMPRFNKSKFYPEGYYLHRTMWVARRDFVKQNPDLVVAFLVALQKGTEAVARMTPEAASELAYEYWKIPAKLGAVVVRDDLIYERGWTWLTKGDLQCIISNSQFMVEAKLIQKAVTWKDVAENVRPVTALIKRAYQLAGGNPAPEVFTDEKATDLRGLPIWDIDKWVK